MYKASFPNKLDFVPRTAEGAEKQNGLHGRTKKNRKRARQADRIIWLRSYWAVTLSGEVEREAEAWLAKLHELAAKLRMIAPDKLDRAVKGYEYLLTRAVRVIAKPQIDERIQQRYMSPSAPNIPEAQLWFDLFYSYEPRITRPSTARFPDGLGDLVGY